MQGVIDGIAQLMGRGGWVMWPLAVLSLVALTLIFERCWFWLTLNGPGRAQWCGRLGSHLRSGQRELAMSLIQSRQCVYARTVRQLLHETPTQAAVDDAIESQRPHLERFMSTLGTIITAAPMLGILGTVTGIISAFRVLSDEAVTDPSQVAAGIAEALLTTVVGLVIAIVVLFPYNAFRVQIDRSLGRMESLAAAVASRADPGDHGS